MIRRVKLKEVKNCWWWFVNGAWLTGGAISLGLVGEYLARLYNVSDEEETTSAGAGGKIVTA
jgi:4-hydroxybenzoate polyprenyltransferase